MKRCFFEADILLPEFDKIDGSRWATIACDQFTSELEYWEGAKAFVGDAPSCLNLILPEVYLKESKERIPAINETMDKYLKDILVAHGESMIYLERVQTDGGVRRGIVGMVDLEAYDYNKGSTSLIRATEGTVLDRIPPRVAVRRDASLELPHVMLLVDDEDKTVIEPVCDMKSELAVAYDFELMQGSGHVSAYFMNDAAKASVFSALDALATRESMAQKYGADVDVLLFAVGDGNHSLATAKATYEEIKTAIGEDAALTHPARYALVEIENLHDDALKFEPIYRVMFGVDTDDVLASLTDYVASLNGNAPAQKVEFLTKDSRGEITAARPELQLTVGTLQRFIDEYIKTHEGAEVDYIHGEESVKALVNRDNAIGFIFDGMAKDQLFKTVVFDGALPRKTFSMGHAKDKRFYIECRKIR